MHCMGRGWMHVVGTRAAPTLLHATSLNGAAMHACMRPALVVYYESCKPRGCPNGDRGGALSTSPFATSPRTSSVRGGKNSNEKNVSPLANFSLILSMTFILDQRSVRSEGGSGPCTVFWLIQVMN